MRPAQMAYLTCNLCFGGGEHHHAQHIEEHGETNEPLWRRETTGNG